MAISLMFEGGRPPEIENADPEPPVRAPILPTRETLVPSEPICSLPQLSNNVYDRFRDFASNIGASSKTRAIQPDIDDQENIDTFSDSNKRLSPLHMSPQARYGKKSASNIGFSSKTRTTQPDIGARNNQKNINKSDANKRYELDMAIAETNCDLCKVMLNFQQDILKQIVENNLRGKRCETMLKNVVEKINRNSATSISDLVNSDTDFHPEHLPAQRLEDFHAAKGKWKMDRLQRKCVTTICKM
ncbi:uncharacterized protein LOC143905916 [Temnothorax americanus]|uniref:uncharacterized protein LOC143905916 n=1 Tax=Temnothorax americanus TaxID=1964332 RepID=UPI004068F9A8